MPETYGLPEPEPERSEVVRTTIEQAIAGQGVVRRTVLYLVLSVSIVGAYFFDPLLGLAIGAAALLMATDKGLE